MSLKLRAWILGLLAASCGVMPALAQNSFAIVCPAQGAPGAQVSCSINLTLGSGQHADALSYNVNVTPSNGAPAATGIAFSDGLTSIDGGSPSTHALGANYYSVGWDGLSPAIAGPTTQLTGTFKFTVPANAVGGQTYTVDWGSQPAQASYQSNPVTTSQSAAQVVNVPSVLVISSPTNGATLNAGTVGAAYHSQTITASGGTSPYSWTATGLPGGLSIGSTTGTISGTPTASGTFSSVKPTVKDHVNATVTNTYTMVISPALSGLTGATVTGTQGSAVAANTISITGGLAPYTWSAPNLATYGLSITSPTQTGSTSVTGSGTSAANAVSIPLTITDANGATFNGNISLTINGPLTITSTQPSLPSGVVGVGYPGTGQVSTLTASGGTPPYVWSVAGSSPNPLPGGLSISSGGAISGTPTGTATNSTVTMQVMDHLGATKTQSYTITVYPALSISGTPSTIPGGEQGVAYTSTTISAAGGSGTYTWSMTGAPTGLTIGSSSGTISGTPTQFGSYNIKVTATDANLTFASVSKTFSSISFVQGVSISGPAAGALPNGTVNHGYVGVNITTTGGTGSLTWSLANSTTLPAGLTLGATGANNSTGTITGTPSAAGTSTFTVQVADTSNSISTRQYSITVYAAPNVTGGGTLAIATVGSSYSVSPFTLTGGAPPVSWSATGLPNGLTINKNTGAITGIPAAGTNTPQGSPDNIQVTVTDANGATAQGSATLAINPALTLTAVPAPVSSGVLAVAIPGIAYKETFTAGGGSGSGYTLSASGAPTGLSFNTGTGVLSGTPSNTAKSSNTFVVTVTDGIGTTANFTYSLAVAPPLSVSGPASLPSATVNVSYSPVSVTAAGGTPPYSWSATGLPPGLNITTVNGQGQVAGTPTALAGSPYSVVVKVTDANGTTATMNYSMSVAALPLTITTISLPTGVINAPYPYTSINAQGGVGAYSWTITGLPPGLTTDGHGNITGTPTTTTGSPFSVTVKLSDAGGNTLTQVFPLTISNVLTIAVPTTLPTATLNVAYAPITVKAGGGVPPYTWTATGLPTGMSIGAATGVISGTPTTATGSPFNVSVTVKDSTGTTASMSYSLAVASQLSISAPTTLPAATIGAAYTSTTITAVGGSGVYTWTATGLPTGLSIGSTTGAITGTPTGGTPGSVSVTVTVTDSNSATATMTYTLTLNPSTGAPTITSISTSAGGQQFIAPNTYVSIYGTNFTSGSFTDTWTNAIKNSSTSALPQVLDNVSVDIGGTPAYVAYISPTQINVLTGNIGFGPLAVTVTNGTGTSSVVMVTSQGDIPAFFEWPNSAGQTPGDTSQQPVATHADYSLAAANGTFSTPTVPAKPGETIVLWGAGFGPTTPANPFGVPVPSTGTYVTQNNVTVSINGQPATVYQGTAVLSPGYAGLYQVGVTVPTPLDDGTYPIIVSINGLPSPTLMLAVKN